MIVTNYTGELQPGLSSSSCYSGKETRGLRHQVPQKHGIENLVDHVYHAWPIKVPKYHFGTTGIAVQCDPYQQRSPHKKSWAIGKEVEVTSHVVAGLPVPLPAPDFSRGPFYKKCWNSKILVGPPAPFSPAMGLNSKFNGNSMVVSEVTNHHVGLTEKLVVSFSQRVHGMNNGRNLNCSLPTAAVQFVMPTRWSFTKMTPFRIDSSSSVVGGSSSPRHLSIHFLASSRWQRYW